MQKSEIRQIEELVRKCGDIILNADRTNIDIESKEGSANFVTAYDKDVQEILREGLLAIVPEAGFIGEEGEQDRFSKEGKFFIVDPIDGTTNFIKDYHVSCISVALAVNGDMELAVVYNPYLDEMYIAEKGKGAYCNGKQIQVSNQPLSNGIVLFGTSPYREDLARKTFEMAFGYHKKALDVRRSGSAVWDLCCIAAGRAELFFELILSPWDYAAGLLLVEEAGGRVTTIDGEKVPIGKSSSILAVNGR